MCSGQNAESDNILNNRKKDIMNEYELFNEKTARFFGLFSSDKMLMKGDVISVKGENFVVSNLMIPEDRKLRVAVWSARILIPGDLKDIRFLHWIRQNLIGMNIRISRSDKSIEGVVINYNPEMMYLPPVSFKPHEEPKVYYAEQYPRRLKILSRLTDDPVMIDILEYQTINILAINCSFD